MERGTRIWKSHSERTSTHSRSDIWDFHFSVDVGPGDSDSTIPHRDSVSRTKAPVECRLGKCLSFKREVLRPRCPPSVLRLGSWDRGVGEVR